MNVGLAHSIVPVKPIGLKNWSKSLPKTSPNTKETVSKRIDVGLGQLNIGYFGQRVKCTCQLIEPYTHLDIAASLLK